MNENASFSERAGAFVCLVSGAALLALPLANPDLFWHLSAGRWIVSHGALPRADWLSHSKAGAPWADFEWLAEVLYYGLQRLGGMNALWAFKAVLVSASGAAFWRLLSRLGVGVLGCGLGVLAWILASPSANDLRPENFSLLMFPVLLARLEAGRSAGCFKASPRTLVFCAAYFVLWANLHAGFVYGLGLLALYGASAAFRERSARPLSPLAIAAVAVLLNPYGVGVYTVPWEHLNQIAELQTYIFEWQESSMLSRWLAPFWSIMALAFAALAARRVRCGTAPFEHAALLTALAWSAASHVRTVPYFAAAAVPILAASCLEAVPAAARRAGAWLGTAGTVVFICFQYGPVFARGVGGLDGLYIPERATRFLETERTAFRGKRLFNPWHWGGYLGWRLEGEVPVFVDGRYIFHDFLAPIYAASDSPQTYAAFMDAHRIEAAVIQHRSQALPMPVIGKDGAHLSLMRPFYIHFLPRQRWALVHWDSRALVFARRDAFDAAWVKAHEYRWFRPDDLSAAALAVDEGTEPFAALAAETNRWALSAAPEEARAARDWLAGVARSP